MTELKPCPICGGRPKETANMWDAVVYPDVPSEYCVMCQSCDYEVRSDISMEDAEMEWNRRVYDPIEELRQNAPIPLTYEQMKRYYYGHVRPFDINTEEKE